MTPRFPRASVRHKLLQISLSEDYAKISEINFVCISIYYGLTGGLEEGVCKEMLSGDLKDCDFVCKKLHGFGSVGRGDDVYEAP